MTAKPKPIVYTGLMVLAIMDDLKTQSRRIINHAGNCMHNGQLLCDWPLSGDPYYDKEKKVWLWELQTDVDDSTIFEIKPRHKPGDIVYVGEHLFNQDCFVAYKCDDLEFADPETRKAKVWPWKKSLLSNIFMPRWAARTYLEILDVKAEKIQDISTEDVIAEGIDVLSKLPLIVPPDTDLDGLVLKIARMEMKKLWNSIHGPDAWKDNDWVWVYKFKRVEKLEED